MYNSCSCEGSRGCYIHCEMDVTCQIVEEVEILKYLDLVIILVEYFINALNVINSSNGRYRFKNEIHAYEHGANKLMLEQLREIKRLLQDMNGRMLVLILVLLVVIVVVAMK